MRSWEAIKIVNHWLELLFKHSGEVIITAAAPLEGAPEFNHCTAVSPHQPEKRGNLSDLAKYYFND